MSKKVRRLSEGFRPTNYVIDLDPDRASMRLTGTVTITGLKRGRPSQRLTFHQHGLKITSASVTRLDKKGEQIVEIERINHQRTLDEVRLHSPAMLYGGSYRVTMTFEGTITSQMEGIYPCNFQEDGVDKQLIATQFESHHAREAFPCIDEPEAKATFDLTLHSPLHEAVVSNTPVAAQAERNGKLVTTFETTPKMSTYLLAFVYGDMQYKEATTKDGVLVRAHATPSNVAFTDFALETAVRSLEFYNDYFDTAYPLPKCDLLALPDFASGAMENWGCITFREQCLLVDPENTSLSTKQYVAMVVAHELAHQWFGNLVTMRWWTDLWLNEGFASWIEYLAVDYLFPEWQMWTQFIFDEQSVALKLDALQNTHPIEVTINHPDEIRTIFDTISYNKGASVIHMLEQFLGHDVFRDGLRHYLKKHAYSNTDTTDLWQALETVSKKPVTSFMSAWTSQAGFPIVHATIQDHELELRQEPFLVNPAERAASPSAVVWPIALGSNDAQVPELFDKQAAHSKLTEPDQLKLNHDQSGFFRVLYNTEHLSKLAGQVRAGKLSPLDRLSILSDAFEGAKASYGPTTAALDLLANYAGEDNSVVWDVMVTNLSAIRAVMNDETIRNAMKPYVRKLVAAQLARLGWDPKPGESHFDTLLRVTILALASSSDEKSVVDEALRRFNTMQRTEDVPPDFRGFIYATAARHGDESTFDKLLALHNATQSSEERVTLSSALTNFKQPELIQRALSLITTDAVRLQDVSYWIAYSFSNRFARQATWDWMVAHWDWLAENLSKDLSFYRMPIYAARCFSDAAFLPTFKAFFESIMEPALERSVNQGIEIIEWQSAWRARDLESIRVYFARSAG